MGKFTSNREGTRKSPEQSKPGTNKSNPKSDLHHSFFTNAVKIQVMTTRKEPFHYMLFCFQIIQECLILGG